MTDPTGVVRELMQAFASPLPLLLPAVVATVVGLSAALVVSRQRSDGVRVAYTRKTFHFLIFTAAAVIHLRGGLASTVVYGSVIASLVLWGVWKGDGHGFYEAMARDSDRPRRTLFIVVPLVTTAVGGLASALLAGPFATVGYLAAGWGDAVGEPVGARWGRHPYRVPSLGGVPAIRTLEGSAAVFLVSTAGAILALLAIGIGPRAWTVGLACGVVAALVEAVSNHGLDNLTVQIAASLTAFWLLGS